MLMELVDSQFRPSRFPSTFATALTYVTLTLTLPNALFTFLSFPKEALANGCVCCVCALALLYLCVLCLRVCVRVCVV